ncbi:MAG: tRNA (N(6)-L-threonylcarbamoyladenosine(37)-C(2))-methylthiotransferase MtaB [Candidatus Caldatribacteriaceae bacterium]
MVDMRIAIKTLGCKVNQAESEVLQRAFAEHGFEIVDFSKVSDIYLINGCAVTQEAERKTRQMVRQALRRNPQARVILTGCAAQLLLQEGKSSWDGQVIVLPTQKKEREIFEYVLNLYSPSPRFSNAVSFSRARSWVKVEDGCDHFCHYCIVPNLRGKVRSESPQEILRQVQFLEENGVKEVVLCGINLGYFGKDISSSLIQLIEFLVNRTVRVRFRLSSLEPFVVEKEFLERYFALGERVCPHFHLPLQSGSDRILQKMGRGYDSAYYRSLVEKIRYINPLVALTTDVIVGFPGETDDDFQQTLRFCEEIEFSRLHVFPFSPRPGTLAFQWEKETPVAPREKKDREKRLLETADKLRYRYHQRFLGREVRAIVEYLRDSFGGGYSEHYLPVRFPRISEKQIGMILRGKVIGVGKDFVEGEIFETL